VTGPTNIPVIFLFNIPYIQFASIVANKIRVENSRRSNYVIKQMFHEVRSKYVIVIISLYKLCSCVLHPFNIILS
jgi:hypothetical protein